MRRLTQLLEDVDHLLHRQWVVCFHRGVAGHAGGNTTMTVDDPAQAVGEFGSIAIGADGLPIISHYDVAAEGLRVTHCGNVTCTAGNLSTAVDDPPDSVGTFTSIAIGVDSLPVISHWDATAAALRVTHCGNATCTAGNVSTIVDDPVSAVGTFTSIAIGSDGLPVIGYRDGTAAALRVTHCGDVACAAGNVSTTVDDPTDTVGDWTSIAIGGDGLPIISYRDSSAGALRVTHCGNVSCTANNVSTTIDGAPNPVGPYTSIAIAATGLPIISHWSSSAQALRVTYCTTAACTSAVSTTVDDPANAVAGLFTSIAIGADGLPVISHWTDLTNTLRVTKCTTRTCQ